MKDPETTTDEDLRADLIEQLQRVEALEHRIETNLEEVRSYPEGVMDDEVDQLRSNLLETQADLSVMKDKIETKLEIVESDAR